MAEGAVRRSRAFIHAKRPWSALSLLANSNGCALPRSFPVADMGDPKK